MTGLPVPLQQLVPTLGLGMEWQDGMKWGLDAFRDLYPFL
jgi:hypothetical protein